MDKYNKYFPGDADFDSLAKDREIMLKELLGKVGSDVFVEPPLYVDYGCNISIGERFYANFKYVLTCRMRPPSQLPRAFWSLRTFTVLSYLTVVS